VTPDAKFMSLHRCAIQKTKAIASAGRRGKSMAAINYPVKRERASKAGSNPSQDSRVVRIFLYGGLSSLMLVRPAIVNVPHDATVGSIVGELSLALGPRFTEGVMHAPNQKRGVCRIFVNGVPVELDDRLPPGDAVSDLELIVLTAIEGG
jgi:hypothetical protein